MLFHIRFWIVGFFAVLSLSPPSQGQQYPFTSFTNQDGLGGMQVMRLFQDSRNVLWIATKTGLTTYDGERFRPISPKEFPNLNPFRLGGMVETSDKAIWIANDTQVFRFDGQTLEKYSLPPPWRIERYEKMYLDKKGNVMVRALRYPNHRETAIFCFKKDQPIRKITFPHSPWSGAFFPVFFDAKHDTWYGHIPGTDGKNSVTVYYYPGKWGRISSSQSHGEYLGNYTQTKTGEHLIQTKNNLGLTCYYELVGPGQIKLYAQEKDSSFQVFYSLASSVPLTFHNRVFFIPAHQQQGTEVEMNHEQINDVTRNRVGTGYFLATEKGLRHIHDNGFRFFYEKEVPYVWNVVPFHAGGAWLGNFTGGLLFWDEKNMPRPETRLPPVIAKDQPDQPMNPRDLSFYYNGFQDPVTQDAWFPCAQGLLKYDHRTQRIVQINSESIFTLLDDPANGLVWQGTHDGILATNKQTGKLVHQYIGDKDIPLIRYYMIAYRDRKGGYWFGGKGGLLHYASYQDIVRKKYEFLPAGKGSIPLIGFLQLQEDAQGTLWGASGNGLFWFDAATRQFRRVDHPQFDVPVNSVLSSDPHTLWVGTNEALVKFNLDTWYAQQKINLTVFNHHTGFLGQEVGQSSLVIDAKRRLWIPSGTVLSYLDLNSVSEEISPTRPYLISLGKKRIPFAHETEDLHFSENQLVLEVGATGFHRPVRAQFSFRVDDEEWSDWTEQSQIYLPTLTNGRHQVEVRSRTLGWEEEEPNIARVQCWIEAPFWESPHFPRYLTLVILVLILMGGVGYVRHLRVRNDWMRVQQRVMQLQLGSLQELLTPHFIYNTLQSIQGLIHHNLPWEANEQIRGLSNILRSYVSVGTGQRNDRFTIREKVQILHDYLQLIVMPLDEPFTYDITVDEDVLQHIPLIPPLMIQPYVENALKHGLLPLPQPGHLTIRFFKERDEIGCCVEDNGQGRAAALERSHHNSLSVSTNLMEERIRIFNQLGQKVRVHMEDVTPRGTRVSIYFTMPENPDHSPIDYVQSSHH